MRGTLAERLWAKVDKNGPVPEHRPDLGPCWIWTGATRGRYGRVFIKMNGVGPGRKTVKSDAHRVSFTFKHGPIPSGLDVDHLCRVPLCVNPDHLEAVTRAENLRRSPLVGKCVPRATVCHNGHPLSGANVMLQGTTGYRRCRKCRSEYGKQYRQRMRK